MNTARRLVTVGYIPLVGCRHLSVHVYVPFLRPGVLLAVRVLHIHGSP